MSAKGKGQIGKGTANVLAMAMAGDIFAWQCLLSPDGLQGV